MERQPLSLRDTVLCQAANSHLTLECCSSPGSLTEGLIPSLQLVVGGFLSIQTSHQALYRKMTLVTQKERLRDFGGLCAEPDADGLGKG